MSYKKKRCKTINGKRFGKRKGKKYSLEGYAEDNLQSKIIKFPPLKDLNGRYIPYCDLPAHQGLNLRPYVCEERDCKHYHKLYLTKETNIYKK